MNHNGLTVRVKRCRLPGIALLLAALVVAACGDSESASASGPQGSEDGDSLVIAIADEPSTLDPQATEDGNERAITDNVYETLLRRDSETNDLEPLLATELPTQVDGTTWEFRLREGVTFTNGEPFNAEAAAYSVNRVMNPDYNSAQVDFFGGITEAEAIDSTTLHVKTSEPDPVLPARMYRLKMVPPTASQETSFTEHPVGTGPYKFVGWDRGQQVKLEANPDYWADVPEIQRVTFRFISQAGTRVAGVRSGEIHLATLLPPEQADDAPKVLAREGLEPPVYRFKNYEGVLEDPRIRQAMNYAVDKDALADDLFSGYASVAPCQPLTPGHFGFNPNLEAYPYDPDKARDLLDAAGYDGETVGMLGATGRWLKDAEMHEAVIGYLSEVGVNIDADIRPFSSYVGEFVKTVGEPQPDMGFVSASNELFDAAKISSYYSSEGGLSSYINDDVDAALAAAARATDDPDAREAEFHKALEIGCEEDPVFLFTVYLHDIYGAVESLEWQPRIDGSLYVPEMSLRS